MTRAIYMRIGSLALLVAGLVGCASYGRIRPEYLVGLPVNNAIKQFGLTRYEKWQAPRRAKGLDSELRYFMPEGDMLIRYDANGIIQYSHYQASNRPAADRKLKVDQDWARWEESQRRRHGNRIPVEAQFSSFPKALQPDPKDEYDYPGKGIPGGSYPGSKGLVELPGTDYPGKELEPPGTSTPNRFGNPNFPDARGNQNVTERFPSWNDPAARRPNPGL